jgi:hypothetical protein
VQLQLGGAGPKSRRIDHDRVLARGGEDGGVDGPLPGRVPGQASFTRRRPAWWNEVGRVAAPGVTLLMFAFGEKGRGTPVAAEVEIRHRFSEAFDVVEARQGVRFLKATWYRMIRRAA